ncbi:retrovirus-related pol polyprotein from transposon TNT 1-94 [Tanacetum coccineum]
MRYSIAKNSLIKAHINCYSHPFNKTNFAFVRNSKVPERPSRKFRFLGIVERVLWYLDSGCSKHMTGQLDKLINFVSKFIGTVRFVNDHFEAIMGYGDLQIGDILISRLYTDDVGITYQMLLARNPQQNGVVERRNHTLVEAAHTMLNFSKSPLFLWAEVVATACYTQIKSFIHTRYNKTPYELLRDRKPDLKFLYIFGALCYPTNYSRDLGKLKPKADIRIFISYSPSKKAYRIYNKRTLLIMETIHVQFDELTLMAYEQQGSGPELQSLTSGQISSGLYFKPPPSAVSTVLFAATLQQDTVGATSISIDQDEPSPSTILNTETILTPIQDSNVEEPNQENKNAKFDNDTFTNPFAPLVPSSDVASSRIVDTLNMHTFQQPQTHIKR